MQSGPLNEAETEAEEEGNWLEEERNWLEEEENACRHAASPIFPRREEAGGAAGGAKKGSASPAERRKIPASAATSTRA